MAVNITTPENNFIIHPHTAHLPLVSSGWSPVIIITLYLLFVKVLGPKFMKNRSPMKLKIPMIAYNVIQIVFNIYIFIRCCAVIHNIDPLCGAIDYAINKFNAELIDIHYYYYLLKISDIVDTIFFVLRKKDRQLSFLHIYHHSTMILGGWIGCRYVPGGKSTFVPFINTFVHAIMYTYYLLTNISPSFRNNAWWKKYITQMQLIQQMFFTIIFAYPLLTTGCRYPKEACYFAMPSGSAMVILFMNFYVQSYRKGNKTE